MTAPRIIRASSSEIRAVFEDWLTIQFQAAIRLIVLEGLMNSGKTCLTATPFSLGMQRSTNIALDRFLRAPVPATLSYADAIDLAAASAAIAGATGSSTLVVVEGAIVWPVVQRWTVGLEHVRRVYLKRMMRLRPDYWQDERSLAPEFWPASEFSCSISRYHAQEQPWLKADLVLERIEDG